MNRKTTRTSMSADRKAAGQTMRTVSAQHRVPAPPSTTFLWNLPQHPAANQTLACSTATMTATVMLSHHGSFLTGNAVDSSVPSTPAQTVTLAHGSRARTDHG